MVSFLVKHVILTLCFPLFAISFLMLMSCPAGLMFQCSSQRSVFSSTALTKLQHNEQDLLALKEDYTTRSAVEETINDPTNPKHYWRYRMCIRPLCCLSVHPPNSQNRNIRGNLPFLYICDLIKTKVNQVFKLKCTEKCWVVLHVPDNSSTTYFTMLDPLSIQSNQF